MAGQAVYVFGIIKVISFIFPPITRMAGHAFLFVPLGADAEVIVILTASAVVVVLFADTWPDLDRPGFFLRNFGLSGIVTERDVLRAVAAGVDLASEPVTAWMTPNPDTVPADMTVDDAAVWMVAAGYRHLPVMDGQSLLGVASIKDLLWAITEQHLNEDASSGS